MSLKVKDMPEPTIATLQAAMKGRVAKPHAMPPEADMSPPLMGRGAPKKVEEEENSKTEETKVVKTSDPEHVSGGQYKTRDSRPKK